MAERILKYLSENPEVNTLKLAEVFKEDHQKVIGALKSIQANGDLVSAEPVSDKQIELTTEGKLVAKDGKNLRFFKESLSNNFVFNCAVLGWKLWTVKPGY